jgi:hypothetical protein
MIAEALRDWLPCVIQAAEPWMSESDIAPGDRWSTSLADQLEDAHFGIICLTPENLKAPWIHFEAGALSKVIGKSHVCPYLFDLDPKNLEYPLAQFQAIKSDGDGTKKLVHTINNALDAEARLPDAQFIKIHDKWWPDLEVKLKDIPDFHDVETPKRDIDDMIMEMMELIRSQSEKLSNIFKVIQFSSSLPYEELSGMNRLLYDEYINKKYNITAENVSKILKDNGVVVENDEIVSRLKLLIDKFGVPPNEATRSTVNYFLKKHGRSPILK